MTTLASNDLSLVEVAKRMDPNGSAAAIAELLNNSNEILTDMPWVEGNLPTGHRVTVRTGLPDVYWRLLNQGVSQSRSTTAQIDEGCGMLEAFGQIDVDLAMLNGNTAAFRLQENMAFLEAMNQEMASTLFYGSTATDPEKFNGLDVRFNDITGPENADNIIDGGGSTNITSIWLVGWSPSTVFGIYPKGSKAGLVHEDLGIDTVLDANSKKYRAYHDRYQWKCGLAVRDWRYVVRIANIDVTALTKAASSGADIIDLMTRALERIQGLNGVRPAFYMNRTLRSFLRRQTVNKVASSSLSYDKVGGSPVLSFAEVPVRRSDALSNSETRVV